MSSNIFPQHHHPRASSQMVEAAAGEKRTAWKEQRKEGFRSEQVIPHPIFSQFVEKK
jgi:hypothetical protein